MAISPRSLARRSLHRNEAAVASVASAVVASKAIRIVGRSGAACPVHASQGEPLPPTALMLDGNSACRTPSSHHGRGREDPDRLHRPRQHGEREYHADHQEERARGCLRVRPRLLARLAGTPRRAPCRTPRWRPSRSPWTPGGAASRCAPARAARHSTTSSRTERAADTSSPSVGSSRNRIHGLFSRPRARFIFCRWPVERDETLYRRCSSRPRIPMSSSTRHQPSKVGSP